MFGKLKRFNREKNLCGQCPFVYVYTENFVYTYEIFSYYITGYRSTGYDRISSPTEYDAYIENALRQSGFDDYEWTIDFDMRPQLLTLSTCSGSTHLERFLVHAALDIVEPYIPMAEVSSRKE